MLIQNLRLALLSGRRYPLLTLLMVAAIAVGIAASTVTMALYHARTGNPIAGKADQLFAVALDNRPDDPQVTRYSRNPQDPPFQLTYRDAAALFASDIPVRKVRMFKARQLVDPGNTSSEPFAALTRVTSTDFFQMFEVPFKYGGAWSSKADEQPEPVIVLSAYVNQRLFGGADSVGRQVTLGGQVYRVAGVLEPWLPQPKFYDLSTASFALAEDVYIPFGWAEAREINTAGRINCLGNAQVTTYRDTIEGECTWIQFWAELPSADHVARFREFTDNYVAAQKELGRFPRPLNNRVADVTTWLEMNDVVGNDSRLLVIVALLFLLICILNTSGLTLAKFLGSAPMAGVRRALGATRADIVKQYLTETVCVAVAGGVLGILLAGLGLWMVRELLYLPAVVSTDNPQALAMARSMVGLDPTVVAAALLSALVSGLLAGLYPAWRIGRIAPATFLRNQ